MVARQRATGELHTTRIKRSKSRKTRGQIVGFFVVEPDPKSWATLADKPATIIAKQLKLLDYTLLIGSSITNVHSSTCAS